MIKKRFLFLSLLLLILIFIVFKIISYSILESNISYDNKEPKIKLSQIIGISEANVRYSKNYYINNDFVGFNATIDNKYFITVTKLGKASSNYQFISTNKIPENNTNIIGLAPSDVEDMNSRYINLKSYPFTANKIYYYIGGGKLIKSGSNKFYEFEAIFSSFNVSFTGENSKDFGFVGPKREKSISFINYDGNLYVLNFFPIGNNIYKSLHSLLNQ